MKVSFFFYLSFIVISEHGASAEKSQSNLKSTGCIYPHTQQFIGTSWEDNSCISNNVKKEVLLILCGYNTLEC